MIFSAFSKNLGFWVFLVHPIVVLVLLSASVERCFVSRMRDFSFWGWFRPLTKHLPYWLRPRVTYTQLSLNILIISVFLITLTIFITLSHIYSYWDKKEMKIWEESCDECGKAFSPKKTQIFCLKVWCHYPIRSFSQMWRIQYFYVRVQPHGCNVHIKVIYHRFWLKLALTNTLDRAKFFFERIALMSVIWEMPSIFYVNSCVKELLLCP